MSSSHIKISRSRTHNVDHLPRELERCLLKVDVAWSQKREGERHTLRQYRVVQNRYAKGSAIRCVSTA
eukprot:3086854-Rhodomonas_salina.1